MSELIHSDTAILHNINNMPDTNSLDCMLDLIFYFLQPVRNIAQKPVIVLSCYRNKRVNELVGGSNKSQHLRGQAVDFIIKGMTPTEIIKMIVDAGIEYDQLINEYDRWVHVSFVKDKNRKQKPFKIS